VKVLLIHNEYRYPSGEEVVVAQERELLQRAGHQVVTYHRSNWETESDIGLGQLGLIKRIVWASDSRQAVARLLASEKPDVVHIHNTFMVISPSVYSACRDAGVPVVQTLHNFRLFCPDGFYFRDGHVCEDCREHSLWRGLEHACYRNSRSTTAAVALLLKFHHRLDTWNRAVTFYVACSEFARSRFVAAGLPADRVTVKPNFMHPDPGRPTGARDYAMFAGRLSAEKGVSTLLHAWSRLKTRIPLMIAGEGPALTELQAESHRLDLASVLFEGHLSREQTLATMKGARFLLVPSLWYENFPMTIVEAFACGTPVIASRLGSMAEIVQDGRVGLNFATGDAEDLAAKVEWAWNNPEKTRALGQEARREYETRYTAEKNYDMLMEIYDSAIQRRGVQGASLPREIPNYPQGCRP
jgi:glycosyltransferase involved in cell wall biosynthesis